MSNGRHGFGSHGREDRRTGHGGNPKQAGGAGRSSPGDEYHEIKAKLNEEPLFVAAGAPDRKAPNKELFDAIAPRYAEHIRKGGLADNTQLRRWFNAVDELNNKAVRGVLSSEHIQAEMALLRARIAYAHRRPGVKVPSQLVDFVTIGSKKVNNADDLFVFRCLFECVVAYHRAPQRDEETTQ